MILLFTAITVALIAGLFFNWSCAVTLGLGKLSDVEYLGAMQSINREIQNPVFLLCFMGAMVLLPISTCLNYTSGMSYHFWLLVSATLFYWIGVFGVTMMGNVPLNTTLEAINLKELSIEQIKESRVAFENTWNTLNWIRTIASISSLVLVLVHCIFDKN